MIFLYRWRFAPFSKILILLKYFSDSRSADVALDSGLFGREIIDYGREIIGEFGVFGREIIEHGRKNMIDNRLKVIYTKNVREILTKTD